MHFLKIWYRVNSNQKKISTLFSFKLLGISNFQDLYYKKCNYIYYILIKENFIDFTKINNKSNNKL